MNYAEFDYRPQKTPCAALLGALKLLPTVALWLLFTILSSCGGDHDSSGLPAPTFEPSPSPTPTASPDPDFDRFEYSYGDNSQQFGILRTPKNIEYPLSVVVIIHGGCWLSQYGLDLMTPLAEELTRQGKATWNIEYRRLGSGGEWPVIFEDTIAAIENLASIAEPHNLRLDNIVAVGHSAGGHLALWAASRANIDSNSVLYRDSYIGINGALGLGAVTDLTTGPCNSSLTTLIDGNALPENALSLRLANTSPIHMLPSDKNTSLFSGSADTIVPPAAPIAYTDAATSNGDNSEHLILERFDHFDLIDPDMLDIHLFVDTLDRLSDTQ